jgi:maltose alpha-D-glucosyltransferase/alpha-amylase
VSFTVTAPELAGRTLTDLFGGARFPTFDEEGRATFTLGTQTFFWLKVGDPAAPAVVPTTTTAIPVIKPSPTGPTA